MGDSNSDSVAKSLTRRAFLETAGIATLAIGAGAFAFSPLEIQAAQPYSGKPSSGYPLKSNQYNVLFILTDQERYLPELLGKGHWPGRDRLIKMGTTFENHQVCSMVCTPSRSVIFTGQHIQHTKMFDNTNFPWIDDMSYDIPTIGHMMRDAGYYSTYQGKWHLNEQIHEHFDDGDPYQMVGRDIMDKYGFSDFTGIGDAVGDPLYGYYTDQFVTATAQAWLRRTGKFLNEDDKPWFMTLSLVNPHDVMFYDTDEPGQKVQGAAPTMYEMTSDLDDTIYKKKWDVPLSASRNEAWDKPGQPQAHYDYQKSMPMLTGKIPKEDERWKKMQDYYFNCLSDNDRSVDTILTELENLGMLANTIVVMTSDHGELCGAHGMSGKGATAYREQNNVPLIIYHPDVPGGRTCKAVTAHNDIVPTILAVTDADKKQKKEVTDKLRGHDVSPLLQDPQAAGFDAVRDGALYCFSMWAFMDGDWLKKVATAGATGESFTLDTMPRPDITKRSNIRTVFDGRYKYSRYFNSQKHNHPVTLQQIFEVNDVELFDLDNDPNEMNNLALDKEKNKDILLSMNDKLNQLIDREVGTDDGSHLPNITGVNWAFDRFDP